MRPWAQFLVCLAASLCLSLYAGDVPAYQVGQVAASEVVTPVPLDVADPAATAALRLIKSQQYPAIFRSVAETSNVVSRNFLSAFTQARSNFLADVAIEFHARKLDEAAISSGDFGRLVTVFGVENRSFPVTDELAAEWARGGDGAVIRDRLLATLQWAESRPVRPDALPEGMVVGETVRLVPVAAVDEKLSFETVQQGRLVSAATVTTVSNVQALFRREFSGGQQLFARALAGFLQPNCFPDEPFTQLTRGTAVYKLVVADHFDAGDAIIHRGDTIDAKMVAALNVMSEKLKSARAAAAVPATAVTAGAAEARPSSPLEQTAAIVAPAVAKPNAMVPAAAPVGAAPVSRIRHWGLVSVLASVSVLSLLVAAWQYWREKRQAKKAALAAQVPLPLPGAPDLNLAPQVAQAVREAVQQELAMQRRELLMAQQAAANEIAALVRRLDDLQVPMQERLHTYETRIQSLEKELALRNEENRELLRLKIEMTTRQLEAERAATLVPPFAA